MGVGPEMSAVVKWVGLFRLLNDNALFMAFMGAHFPCLVAGVFGVEVIAACVGCSEVQDTPEKQSTVSDAMLASLQHQQATVRVFGVC